MKIFALDENLREQLINEKKDFTEITTTSSKTIIYKDLEVFISPSYIPKKYMYLFKQIRNDIKKNREAFQDFEEGLTVKDVKYFARKKAKLHEDIKNAVEFDLNKAYYVEAHNRGFVSDKYFQKALDAPKKLRLVLLGSIASLKITTHYKGGEIFEIEPPATDQFLRDVWFSICKGVGDKMYNFVKNDFLRERFLFMWVDALFFRYENEAEKLLIEEILINEAQKVGHSFKRVDIDYIEERGNYFNVYETGRETSKLFCVY